MKRATIRAGLVLYEIANLNKYPESMFSGIIFIRTVPIEISPLSLSSSFIDFFGFIHRRAAREGTFLRVTGRRLQDRSLLVE